MYLTKEERDLIIKIWKADKKTLDFLKKEYPDLCFILELWKIASKYNLNYQSPQYNTQIPIPIPIPIPII